MLFLTVMCTSVHAQKLSGTFRFDSKILDSGYEDLIFKDNTFSTYRPAGGQDVLGRGNYVIANKVLKLYYQNYPGRDSSSYTILDKPYANAEAKIKIQSFEEQSNIPLVSILVLSDYAGKQIMTLPFSAQHALTVADSNTPGYISIIQVGYHTVNIPVKRLLGKDNEIIIHLKVQDHVYIPKSTISYKIIKLTKDEIILLDSNRQLKRYVKTE